TSGPEFQLPRTVTPFNGLCLESCAVTRTFANQVSTALVVNPSILPTCTLGGFTLIAIARALLLAFASGNFCVAVRICPLIAAPPVFQLIVPVTLAPIARPAKVWVPTTTLPAVPSVSTTSKLVVTSCPPTFCTVTTTVAVSPTVTLHGVVILANARSDGCGLTLIVS